MLENGPNLGFPKLHSPQDRREGKQPIRVHVVSSQVTAADEDTTVHALQRLLRDGL